MKKIVILLSMILSSSTIAETYKLNVTSNHLDKNAIVERNTNGDVIPTCTLPETLNEAKDTCEVPIPECTFPDVVNTTQDGCINTFDKVGWIDRTDACQGVRPLTVNNNVIVLKANTANRINSPIIPEGYRWLTTAEYQSMTSGGGTWNYYSHCGHTAYPNNVGATQYEISFSDTSLTGLRTHAGTTEGGTNSSWNYPTNWLGIVVTKDN